MSAVRGIDPVYVFDACALIALLRAEPGAEALTTLLADPQATCLMQAVNVCEVAYDALRRDPTVVVADLEATVEALGVHIHREITPALLAHAARLKAHWRRVALADCFALALAALEGGALITSDHHELDALAASGEIPIRFFR